MGLGFSIIRGLARLMAMGALTGSAILFILCCISSPVINKYNFSTTSFDDGGELNVGMWGYCYTNPAGVAQCSGTAVGYNLTGNALPKFSANTGTANLNVIDQPLSGALIFFPLATGATLLTLLLSLVPIRMVTLIALGTCFLAIGASTISAGIALAVFIQCNSRLGLLFTPNTFVHPKLGMCLWFSLATVVGTVGAFLFLLIAVEPKKVSVNDVRAYGDMVQTERTQGTDYSRRYSVEKARTATGASYKGGNGVERSMSRRSAAPSGRYVAATDNVSRSYSRNSRHSHGASQRSGGRGLREELESDLEEGRPARRSSRVSRRRDIESEEESDAF